MKIQVTLRGVLAGNGQSQNRMMVKLPLGSTVESLLGELSIPSIEVQMALVNGRPVARTSTLSDGDRVILAGAN